MNLLIGSHHAGFAKRGIQLTAWLAAFFAWAVLVVATSHAQDRAAEADTAHSEDHAAAPDAPAPDHGAQSDTVETRPLKFLMVALGQDMNRINDGLWHEDYEMVRMGAQAIANHPRVPPGQMAAIRDALGPRFQQFVGFDQQVHGTAVELTRAAERRDLGDILDTYRRIQDGCLACHAAFRNEVRMHLYGQTTAEPNDTPK